MRRVPRTLLLIAAVSLPVSCVTAGGSTADSEARKSAMTADRQSVMLGARSMEELRYAGSMAQQAFGHIRVAATTTGKTRQANIRAAHRVTARAGKIARRADHIASLGVVRLALRADLERLLQEQERYYRTHDRFAPAIRNLDLEPERESLRIVSADAEGFVAIAEDGSTRCAMTVEFDESREERPDREIACG